MVLLEFLVWRGVVCLSPSLRSDRLRLLPCSGCDSPSLRAFLLCILVSCSLSDASFGFPLRLTRLYLALSLLWCFLPLIFIVFVALHSADSFVGFFSRLHLAQHQFLLFVWVQLGSNFHPWGFLGCVLVFCSRFVNHLCPKSCLLLSLFSPMLPRGNFHISPLDICERVSELLVYHFFPVLFGDTIVHIWGV